MTKKDTTWKGRVLRTLHTARWIILALVILGIVIRLMLPSLIERYVNKQLNKPKDYGGRLETVYLQLWRGQYQINKLAIFKKDGGVHVRLFSVDKMYLSIQWKELFHGAIVGKVIMEQPRLNIVSGPTAAETQTGTNESWGTMLSSLFPFDLNRLDITNGQIHFENEHSTPPVDIYLNGLGVVATNLSNSRDLKSELPAGIKAHATTIGGGGLALNLQLNPVAQAPTYQAVTQLTNVDLTALNNFLKAYGKFDVASGQFAFYSSVASKDGNYDGYIKVFFNHLDVFAWEKERKKNALQVFWDAIVGGVADILKNHSTESLATRVPISGSYKGQKIGTWTAVASMLRNAFVRALVPKVDEKITVKTVEKKETKSDQLKESVPSPDTGGGHLAPTTQSSPP